MEACIPVDRSGLLIFGNEVIETNSSLLHDGLFGFLRSIYNVYRLRNYEELVHQGFTTSRALSLKGRIVREFAPEVSLFPFTSLTICPIRPHFNAPSENKKPGDNHHVFSGQIGH